MTRGRSLRALSATLLAVALLLGGSASSARASGARVRWLPSPDARVTGYRLYIRAARVPYGPPLDVHLPPAAADGTLSAVISGLVPTRLYHVAVAAYTAKGLESPLSAELALGVLSSCTIDQCTSPTTCDFSAVEDGTWCARDGGGDPCAAIGTCEAGQCVASATGPGQLDSARVRISVRRGVGRAVVRGAFAAAPGFDPRVSGAVFELTNGAGAILYRAEVSGDGFTGASDGSVFRHLSTRHGGDANGLRVVYLFRSGGRFAVTVRAESVDLRAALAEPDVRVTLRFGETCARALDLPCSRIAGSATCR